MIRGSSLMLLLQLGERVIGVASLSLLTRLLTPSDFGLVALATAASGMLTAAIATNFSAGVISLRNPDRSDYDTAWTLNAARGVALALLLCMASLLASRMDVPRGVPPLLAVLAITPLLDGFRNVGMAAFQKNLHFAPIVWVGLTARLVGSVTAVVVAVISSSHWALVSGPLVVSVVALLGSFVASAYRPRLDTRSLRKLWAFSGWLAGSNFVGAISNRADVFFVNRFIGLGVAGIYNMGNDIGQMFHGHVMVPLLASLFPGLARLADVREAHLRAFRKAREVLVGVCLPIGIGVALVAHSFVNAMFGKGFELAGPVIAMVSLAFTIHVVTMGMDEILLSIGRTRPIFVRQSVSAVVRLGLMVAGVLLGGIVGLLIGRVAASVVVTLLNARLLCRELSMSVRELVVPHARAIFAASAMAAGSLLWQLSPLRATIGSPFVGLASDVAVGALVFAVSLLGLWLASQRPDGFEREAWNLMSSAMVRGGVR
jgi:O-antigen/teichoic acid export membrane protein